MDDINNRMRKRKKIEGEETKLSDDLQMDEEWKYSASIKEIEQGMMIILHTNFSSENCSTVCILGNVERNVLLPASRAPQSPKLP